MLKTKKQIQVTLVVSKGGGRLAHQAAPASLDARKASAALPASDVYFAAKMERRSLVGRRNRSASSQQRTLAMRLWRAMPQSLLPFSTSDSQRVVMFNFSESSSCVNPTTCRI